MIAPLPSFQARTVTGDGRGRGLGWPTVNLRPEDVPSNLQEGIYACIVVADGGRYRGAMHNGPRPVFHAGPACEVHLLETTLPSLPERLLLEHMIWLRPIRDFPSPEALSAAIAEDVERVKQLIPESALSDKL